MVLVSTSGYAVHDSKSKLIPFRYDLDMGEEDVHIEVKYCGVCHSDLHQILNEWGTSIYPMVPGHEIVGLVKAIGKKVKNFSVGDKAAVGCFIDSCKKCFYCNSYKEEYCLQTPTETYNSYKRDGKTKSFGGYGKDVVAKESFVYKLDDKLDMARAAPLLCAGITVYSPMKHWNMLKPHNKIAIIGLGGLGHMAIKFGVSCQAEVSVISSTLEKKDDALNRLKAKEFILNSDENALKNRADYFDFIIDTLCAPKNMNQYLSLLKPEGVLVILGMPPKSCELTLPYSSLITKRKSIAGSLVGGTKITQEMLDYCASNQILCDVEIVPLDSINSTLERLKCRDVRYRFVLDVGNASF